MKSFIAMTVLSAALIPSLAAAATPAVKEIDDAAAVMGECTKIVDEIVAMKVPAGHAQARAMKAANEHPATDPKAKVALEPVHQQFIDQIEARVKRLDECGKKYEAALPASEALIAKLDKMELSDADGAPVGAAFDKYHSAHEKLEDSIILLSKDRQIQSYVHKTLRAHFLKDVKDMKKGS